MVLGRILFRSTESGCGVLLCLRVTDWGFFICYGLQTQSRGPWEMRGLKLAVWERKRHRLDARRFWFEGNALALRQVVLDSGY